MSRNKENEIVAKLKELTSGWTMVARLTAINEEIHNADFETKMELLIFKSEVLEALQLRGTTCVRCSHDKYFT
ncbi:hypothetical protein ACLIBH_07590 [Virgibacillus sp. W0430]|uniref:hypothetical protein n=1 Tax=Virgibacillus sp. W0430 TaxID=3391580 RepID=UPI003F47BD41